MRLKQVFEVFEPHLLPSDVLTEQLDWIPNVPGSCRGDTEWKSSFPEARHVGLNSGATTSFPLELCFLFCDQCWLQSLCTYVAGLRLALLMALFSLLISGRIRGRRQSDYP